jgi:hypothetical protein
MTCNWFEGSKGNDLMKTTNSKYRVMIQSLLKMIREDKIVLLVTTIV